MLTSLGNGGADHSREWTRFNPAAREAVPVPLQHWARITDADPNAAGESQRLPNR